MKCDKTDMPLGKISISDIPVRPKSWGDVIEFASTFKPQAAPGECKVRGLDDISETSSVGELRAALYCEWRRYNHFGHEPEDKVITKAKQVIELIRAKLRMELERGEPEKTSRDAQPGRSVDRSGNASSGMISPSGSTKQSAEHGDIGRPLLKAAQLLALATVGYVFFQILPGNIGLAAGIVLAWTASVTRIFANSHRERRVAEARGGKSLWSWLLAGFLPPAVFCFLWSIAYWSIYEGVGLGEAEVRPGVTGRWEAMIVGAAGGFMYGCLGAIAAVIVRAGVNPSDYRIRGDGRAGRRHDQTGDRAPFD
jgi:hypothetical protein